MANQLRSTTGPIHEPELSYKTLPHNRDKERYPYALLVQLHCKQCGWLIDEASVGNGPGIRYFQHFAKKAWDKHLQDTTIQEGESNG